MTLYALDGVEPEVHADAWVAPGADLIGRVILEERASVWFGCVLRGDNEPIRIGAGSNVQENSVCHTDMGFPLTVGKGCTVGHKAMLHGCTVQDGALIGMGAIVLNGAVIGGNSIVGAGALVTEGKQFPSGVLVVGAPARVVRDLTEEEVSGLRRTADGYQLNLRRFQQGLTTV